MIFFLFFCLFFFLGGGPKNLRMSCVYSIGDFYLKIYQNNFFSFFSF